MSWCDELVQSMALKIRPTSNPAAAIYYQSDLMPLTLFIPHRVMMGI